VGTRKKMKDLQAQDVQLIFRFHLKHGSHAKPTIFAPSYDLQLVQILRAVIMRKLQDGEVYALYQQGTLAMTAAALTLFNVHTS
jgi:hypothetical protein